MEVIVLAAGQGKRMRSVLPKVLQPLAAKPLLAHVLDTARALAARRIVVVYGHGGEVVRDAL
ncbi:NTP transferase domain-containing protein, partial [Zoogloea sp.]|uniref:NTP transferase domain-containing protein n=1 Tax=Zoogloea sp. TaxID=49181 RepID=UPI00263014A0